MAINVTTINGRAYDHGQVEIRIGLAAPGSPAPVHYPMVKALTYSGKLERGKAKGTSPLTRTFTRGAYEGEGSLEMYKTTDGGSLQLLRNLGDGYLEKELVITVTFGVDGDPVTIDTIKGVKLGGTDGGTSEGTEPNVDKFAFVHKGALIDGKQPLNGVVI